MKKHVAKLLKKIAEEKEGIFNESEVKAKYKKLKKAWKDNVKNGNKIN